MNIDPSEIRAMVRVVTQRTGLPVHDEDLEQDAALNAMEAFRKRCGIRNPRAFLMKIVRDTVRDHWRRRRTTDDLSVLDEQRFALSPRLEEEIDRRRQTELLREALERIGSTKRSILELYYAEDLSIAEIGRLQNKSVSAVKMELLRTRRQLGGIVRTLTIRKSR